MVNYNSLHLDTVFAALADPTRRAILTRLRSQPATVSELAKPFSMSLPAISKHLKLLANARLVRQERHGREVVCSLAYGGLKPASTWISEYRQFWDTRLDALASHVERSPDGQ